MSKKFYIKRICWLLVTLFFAFSFQICSVAEDDIDKLYPVYPEHATSRTDPEVLKEHLISYEEACVLLAERFTPGDLNNDGWINSADAGTALRCSAKLESAKFPVNKAGDVNEDGKITSTDARKILRVAAKLDSIVLEREAHTEEEIWIPSLSSYTSGSWRIVEAPKNLTINETKFKEFTSDNEEPKATMQSFAFKTSTEGLYEIIFELSGMENSSNPIRITYLYTVA